MAEAQRTGQERKARSAGFWNFIAPRYARQPIADEASYRHKLDLTRSYLAPDMRVLEFGCGTGSTALLHAPHVAAITGIDYSPRMIEIARGKTEDAPNVTFEVSTIEEWEAPDASYDVVMGMSILHLVADHRAVIAKVGRLLKPGGLFVSSTACIGDMTGIAPMLMPLVGALRLVPRVRSLTVDGLEQDLRTVGYKIEERWQPAPSKAVFFIARKGSDQSPA